MKILKQIAVRRAKLGGKARGWQERKEALQRYQSKPRFCLNCFKQIEVGKKRVCDVVKKRFCNNSCSSKFNNKLRRTLTASQSPAQSVS